jgi:hypothetical protein
MDHICLDWYMNRCPYGSTMRAWASPSTQWRSSPARGVGGKPCATTARTTTIHSSSRLERPGECGDRSVRGALSLRRCTRDVFHGAVRPLCRARCARGGRTVCGRPHSPHDPARHIAAVDVARSVGSTQATSAVERLQQLLPQSLESRAPLTPDIP